MDNEVKIITEEILDKTAVILVEVFQDNKELVEFLSDLDTVNTFGYFTIKGMKRLDSFIFTNPRQQEARIEILQALNNAFLQQGVNLYSMSAFVAELYTPIMHDPKLREAYIHLMPEYKESILTTYGSIFVQSMMLRTLGVRIANLLLPKRIKHEEEMKAREANRRKTEYISSLPDEFEVNTNVE